MTIQPLQFGQYYHIYNRGNNRENLFVEQRNYPYFLKLYAKHILPVAKTFAYCLLPNHFHFAIRTRTTAEQETFWQHQIQPFLAGEQLFKLREPSEAFKNMFIAYTRAFNRATERTGTLFARPFQRKRIDSEAYFVQLITYIHKNPQKHGLIDDYRDWTWSSYPAFVSVQPSHIEREQVVDWFGGQENFAVAHDADLQDLTNLQDLSNLDNDEPSY